MPNAAAAVPAADTAAVPPAAAVVAVAAAAVPVAAVRAAQGRTADVGAAASSAAPTTSPEADAAALPAQAPSTTADSATPASALSPAAAPPVPGTAQNPAAPTSGAQSLAGGAQSLAGAAQILAAATDGSARSALPDSVRLHATSTEAVAPTASALPSVAPTPLATSTATPVAAPAPAAAVPLTAQIMKPLFSLTSAAPGEHVLTISVTPDNLGPVTVRAHVTGEGIRVELFAPTDLARDALRVILPDLRRDLAGSGLSAQLDLSSDSQAGDPGATRQPRSEADGRNPNARSPAERAPDTPLENRASRFGSTHTIDVLA